MPSGQASDVSVPSDLMGARIWGRTGCSSSGTNCATGDCGALECAGRQGQAPATLAEFGLCEWQCLDFYDISLVDGFNLPLTFKPKNPFPGVECPSLVCSADVNSVCPDDLKVFVNGQVVACQSSCVKYHDDKDCCEGAYNNPSCPPSPSSAVFHSSCPNAYSYAKDDVSTKACKNTGYDVIFCEGGSPSPSPTPTPTPTPSPTTNYMFTNSDIKGNDVTSSQQSSWIDCFGPCYWTAGCQSFVWTDYNGGTCWLKGTSDRNQIIGLQGGYTGFICPLTNDKDIAGNDIGSQQAQDAKQCCAYCAVTEGCKAFSWSNYNGGTCWLKSGGNLIDKAEVVAYSV